MDYPPSSSPRFLAAWSASLRMSWKRPSMSTFSAAAVVPPGLVTFSRSVDAGVSASLAARAALPTTVWRARIMALSASNPTFSPAFARASMRWKI